MIQHDWRTTLHYEAQKFDLKTREVYAKPQNETPTDFSTQIDMMIFTYFHEAVGVQYIKLIGNFEYRRHSNPSQNIY